MASSTDFVDFVVRCQNQEILFWHSRMVSGGRVPPAPSLVSLADLATAIRKTYPRS